MRSGIEHVLKEKYRERYRYLLCDYSPYCSIYVIKLIILVYRAYTESQ